MWYDSKEMSASSIILPEQQQYAIIFRGAVQVFINFEEHCFHELNPHVLPKNVSRILILSITIPASAEVNINVIVAFPYLAPVCDCTQSVQLFD